MHGVGRWTAALAALALFGMLVLRPAARARAEAITTTQLAAAALSSDDLPGFMEQPDMTPPPQNDFVETVFRRTLATGAANGFARVTVSLTIPVAAAPTQLVRRYADDGVYLGGYRMQPNYQVTGPLGVGDADQSASFTFTDTRSGLVFAVYIDTFVRGRLIAGVLYAARQELANPALLATYAAAQDAKLTSSGALPAELLAPNANAAQFQAHAWYTSSDSTANTYYCDDDPAWRLLPLDSLDRFDAVAALLAQYPGRTLNQPCSDGATGP